MRYLFLLLIGCSFVAKSQDKINLLKTINNDLDNLELKGKVASVIQSHHTFGVMDDSLLISPISNNIRDNSRMYFNKKGNTLRTENYDQTGAIQSETEYLYEKDILQQTVTFIKANSSKRIINYIHNNKGQLINEISLTEDKDTANILKISYNKKGHILVMRNEDNAFSGQYSFEVKYMYNYDTRIVSFINYDLEGNELMTGEYQFNEQLDLNKFISRLDNRSGIVLISYQPNGKTTTRISINAAGTQSKETPLITTFKYDNEGNWIEKKEFKEGATKGQLWKREITYHN